MGVWKIWIANKWRWTCIIRMQGHDADKHPCLCWSSFWCLLLFLSASARCVPRNEVLCSGCCAGQSIDVPIHCRVSFATVCGENNWLSTLAQRVSPKEKQNGLSGNKAKEKWLSWNSLPKLKSLTKQLQGWKKTRQGTTKNPEQDTVCNGGVCGKFSEFFNRFWQYFVLDWRSDMTAMWCPTTKKNPRHTQL